MLANLRFISIHIIYCALGCIILLHYFLLLMKQNTSEMKTSTRIPGNKFLAVITLLMLSSVFNNISFAQTVWNTASGSTDWNTNGNWSPATVPGAATIAQFNANPTPGTSVSLSAATSPGSINLSSSRSTALTVIGSSATTLTLSGSTTLNGTANALLSNFGSNASTAILTLQNGASAFPISFGGGKFITAASGTGTTIGNIINITANVTAATTTTFYGSGTWNGSTGNTGGVLQLGGTNSFATNITVGKNDGSQSGILEFNSGTAISSASGNGVTVQTNSQLYLNAPNNTTFTTLGTLLLNGRGNNSTYTGKGALITKSGNSYTWAGPVTLASTAAVFSQGTGTLTFTGNIAQTGASAFYTGAGTSSSIGGMVVCSGSVTGTGSDTVLGGGTWNGYTGNFGGVMKLSGTNTFTGGISVGYPDGTSNGILELVNATSGGPAAGATATITVNPFSQLYLNGTTGTAYTSASAASLTLSGTGAGNNGYTGKGALFANAKTFSWASPINIATTGAMITALGGPTYSLTLSNAVTLTGSLVDSTAPGNTSAVGNTIIMSGPIRGAGNQTFLGGGTWNGYSGNFGGVLKIGSGVANAFTGTLTVGNSDGSSSGILEFITNSAGSSTSTGIIINNNSQLVINTPFNASITASGPITLTGTGANFANGYSGRGALFSNGKRWTMSTPINISASGAMITVLGTGATSLTGAIANNGPCTDSTDPGTTTTVGDTISKTGIISGNGAELLLGGGTWDGASGVNGGVLKLTNSSNTFNGGITVGRSDGTSSGILDLNALGAAGGNNITINKNSQLYLSSAAGSYLTGSVTLTLSGAGNNVTANYGRGALKSAGLIYTWPGPISLATSAVIFAGSTLSLSGNISGAGQLIKEGTGTLILAGTSNTWGGGTQITTGSITVNAASALSTGPVIFNQNTGVSSAATLTINSAAQTIGNLSSVFADATGTRAHSLALGTTTTLTINQTSNTTFGAGAVSTLSSVISGTTATVVKTGSGRLTLNSPGSYFYGGLTISAGEICLSPVSTFTLGTAANRCPVTMNGGTLSTTGITASVSCFPGLLNVATRSTIVLDSNISGVGHSLRFSNPGVISDTLKVIGWKGAFDGTSGTKGKLFIGTTTTSLTAPQLALIRFIDGVNSIPAVQTTGGEVVPKITITITPASYGPYTFGSSYPISVSYSTAVSFFTGNFQVQLSNSSGTFTDYTSNIIGTGTTATSGTILATIPPTTDVGGYRVRVINTAPYTVGSADNGSTIFMNGITPAISSVNTYRGMKPGDNITITGMNFNATATNNLVYFGATRAVANAGSTTTSLRVTVPYGATVGPLVVLDSSINIVGVSDSLFVPVFDNSYFDTSSAPFTFATKVDYTTGTGPNIAYPGDLDGDGYADLVTSNRAASITVLQNGRTGVNSFTTVGGIAGLSFSAHATNVKIGDIDNDGRPDIIVANGNNTSSITIYRNTTNFSSAIPRTMTFSKVDINISTSGAQKATLVTLADLDKDGKLDIAVGTNGTNPSQLLILHNNTLPGTITAGSFTMTTFTGGTVDVDGTTGGIAATAAALVAQDFDGDGNTDIAMVNELGVFPGSLSVFRNTSSTPGTISFDAAISLATGGYPGDLQSADLNNDGASDMVVTNAFDNTLTIFKNTSTSGSISFSSTTMDLLAGGGESGIALTDLDADGKIDMCISNDAPGVVSLSVYRNMTTNGGDISFVSNASSLTLATGGSATALTAADLDNDGYPDIISGNSGPNGDGTTNSISIIRNTPIPKIGTINQPAPAVCVNADSTLTYSLAPLPAGVTGRWSSSDTTIATVDSILGKVHGRSAGTINITYTVTVTSGRLTRYTTRTLTVNPLPVVLISGFRGVCQGATITLTGSPVPGTWANGSGAVATVNSSTGVVTGVAASGTEIITYTNTSALGCTNTDTQGVSIILPPDAGAVSGASTVCEASSITLVSTGDPGGSWSSTNTAQATVNAATGVVTGTGAGTPTIIYTVINGCGTDTANKLMTILPIPDAGTISGASSVCV